YYKQAIKVYQQLPQYPARTVGMIYMQYAYCLEHQENSNKKQAGKAYVKAIECLKKANDPELQENALADVIAFFSVNHNKKKKKHFEEKLVQNIVHSKTRLVRNEMTILVLLFNLRHSTCLCLFV